MKKNCCDDHFFSQVAALCLRGGNEGYYTGLFCHLPDLRNGDKEHQRYAAQKLGFTPPEIREQLDSLPDARTTTKADWEKLSRKFKAEIEQRIVGLEKLRDTLDSCIGCSCLSLEKCRL